MLALAHIDIDVGGTISLGELAVALGTGVLAFFTWRLARATFRLDQRTAARERERQEERVRGVARLVDGELNVVQANFEQAIRDGRWTFGWPTPHGAWDRSGALIAETVPEVEALALTLLFTRLGRWETAVANVHASHPRRKDFPIKGGPIGAGMATKILQETWDVRRDLQKLAGYQLDGTPPKRKRWTGVRAVWERLKVGFDLFPPPPT
jgi:hypothetical protein